MSRNRLPDLARIAAARREAALADLHRATAERDAVAARIEALRLQVADARATAARSLSAADVRTAERFAALAESRQAALNLALARLSAAANDRRADAARAHGQSEVLDGLAARADAQGRAERARKLLREAPASGR